jgi:hypothetical protein
MNRMLQDLDIWGEVLAGTAHSFQGSEAPVVILDLTNDSPHWRVRLFQKIYDDNTSRLMNVAISRAKSKLIVLGDFAYNLEKTAKDSFLDRMIRYVTKRYQLRAAGTFSVDWLAERVNTEDRIIVFDNEASDVLLKDLKGSHRRTIFYIPDINEDTISIPLSLAMENNRLRGKIYVIARPLENTFRRSYQKTDPRQRLVDAGVSIIWKLGMLERMVVADDDIVWISSPKGDGRLLGGGFAWRRVSPTLKSEVSKALQLDDVLRACDAGELGCPFCPRELMVAEGRTGLYLKCPRRDCHTRSVDEPGPRNGVLYCKTCGGDLEFRKSRGKRYWQCRADPSHQQPFRDWHCKLPKMWDEP